MLLNDWLHKVMIIDISNGFSLGPILKRKPWVPLDMSPQSK